MAASGLIDRYARSMIDNAAARGYGYDTICRALDLAPDILHDSRVRLGPDALCRISRNVKLMMADEFCGFTTSPCRVGTFELMCGMARRSGTLGEALQRAFRFYEVISDDIGFELHEDGDVATIQMTLAHPEIDRFNFLYEWWFIVWSRLSGWMIGEELPVVTVDFPHPQGGTLEEYSEALSAACRFSQSGARFVFGAASLAQPIVRNADDMQQFLHPKSIDLVDWNDIHRSFRSRLKARLKAHLDRTQSLLSIEEAAAAWNISSQTLRRRLEREYTSYRLLKEEVRRETALKWLDADSLNIGDISIRAGFAETNGLSRALKHWVGVSPSDWRSTAPAQRSA